MYQTFSYQTDLIELWEFFIAPIYLFFIYLIAYIIRNKYYKKSPLKKYFIPALTVKIIGGMGVCLIYNYYYGGGDTCNYFKESKIVSSVLLNNPYDGIRLLFSLGGNFSSDLLKYVIGSEFTVVESSYLIVKIAAAIEVFTLQSFLITSIFFGFLSFWGIWKIYCLFCSYYPTLSKEFALSFLFVPSVFFWGSGILKDTICLAALCFFFYNADGFFLKKKNLILHFLGFLISGYVILIVKVYIIMSFSMCLIILIILNYRSKIKSKRLRIFITPLFITGSIILSFFLIKVLGETYSERYSIENLLETSEITRDYIFSTSGGSSYNLGKIDNSVWGLIKVFPSGVIVTLFRPYIWEAHNIIAIIASLESLGILLLTLTTIFKTGVIKFFSIIGSTNLVFFCIIFSLIFAFSVGISSYNFGTLVRYKIPCIPFYIAGIQIIGFISSQKKSLKDQAKLLKAQALLIK